MALTHNGCKIPHPILVVCRIKRKFFSTLTPPPCPLQVDRSSNSFPKMFPPIFGSESSKPLLLGKMNTSEKPKVSPTSHNSCQALNTYCSFHLQLFCMFIIIQNTPRKHASPCLLYLQSAQSVRLSFPEENKSFS